MGRHGCCRWAPRYCLYRSEPPAGSQSNLSWFTFTGNAGTQPTLLSQGNQSEETPALASYNGALCCVHRGGHDQSLWWTNFNGSNWEADTRRTADMSALA
ncbi:hypothetical protein [Hyalangium sp.]|uniref:hypothetical protein n=1 Tax=Hyalangium sp. TaxID=2028555 RepID=UPI002D55BFF4|nr:hypothetical protein [Hyalangium sp.]HYH99317.1 hypothetical protein [Hyalangium sp.]